MAATSARLRVTCEGRSRDHAGRERVDDTRGDQEQDPAPVHPAVEEVGGDQDERPPCSRVRHERPGNDEHDHEEGRELDCREAHGAGFWLARRPCFWDRRPRRRPRTRRGSVLVIGDSLQVGHGALPRAAARRACRWSRQPPESRERRGPRRAAVAPAPGSQGGGIRPRHERRPEQPGRPLREHEAARAATRGPLPRGGHDPAPALQRRDGRRDERGGRALRARQPGRAARGLVRGRHQHARDPLRGRRARAARGLRAARPPDRRRGAQLRAAAGGRTGIPAPRGDGEPPPAPDAGAGAACRRPRSGVEPPAPLVAIGSAVRHAAELVAAAGRRRPPGRGAWARPSPCSAPAKACGPHHSPLRVARMTRIQRTLAGLVATAALAPRPRPVGLSGRGDLPRHLPGAPQRPHRRHAAARRPLHLTVLDARRWAAPRPRACSASSSRTGTAACRVRGWPPTPPARSARARQHGRLQGHAGHQPQPARPAGSAVERASARATSRCCTTTASAASRSRRALPDHAARLAGVSCSQASTLLRRVPAGLRRRPAAAVVPRSRAPAASMRGTATSASGSSPTSEDGGSSRGRHPVRGQTRCPHLPRPEQRPDRRASSCRRGTYNVWVSGGLSCAALDDAVRAVPSGRDRGCSRGHGSEPHARRLSRAVAAANGLPRQAAFASHSGAWVRRCSSSTSRTQRRSSALAMR